MSTVSRDDVARLAMLSNLKISDTEADELSQEIQTILHYVEQLDELDTAGVIPAYQVTGLTNVLREDEVNQSISREVLIGLAPDSQDNQIKVPKVL